MFKGVLFKIVDLYKARSHKYVKRVPYTDNKGKKRYRYFYKLPNAGVVSTSSLVVGASFAYGQGEQKGHYHIQAISGSGDDLSVTIKHDETGEERTVKQHVLRDLLQGSHASEDTKTQIKQRIDKRAATAIQAAKTGSNKQFNNALNNLKALKEGYPELSSTIDASVSDALSERKKRDLTQQDHQQDHAAKDDSSTKLARLKPLINGAKDLQAIRDLHKSSFEKLGISNHIFTMSDDSVVINNRGKGYLATKFGKETALAVKAAETAWVDTSNPFTDRRRKSAIKEGSSFSHGLYIRLFSCALGFSTPQKEFEGINKFYGHALKYIAEQEGLSIEEKRKQAEDEFVSIYQKFIQEGTEENKIFNTFLVKHALFCKAAEEKIGETLEVYRAFQVDESVIPQMTIMTSSGDLESTAASSFSSKRAAANKFAHIPPSGQAAVVIKMNVPVEHCLYGHYADHLGILLEFEKEIVVGCFDGASGTAYRITEGQNLKKVSSKIKDFVSKNSIDNTSEKSLTKGRSMKIDLFGNGQIQEWEKQRQKIREKEESFNDNAVGRIESSRQGFDVSTQEDSSQQRPFAKGFSVVVR